MLRHAGARTVRLTLQHAPSRLLVRIRDDGPHHRSADTTSGHGIDGMRERARALSGRLTAAPHPEGGFEVCAELPHPGPAMMSDVRPSHPMTEPIRVLIADDEALVRGGFRVLIDTEPGMIVVGEAADGATAVDLTRKTHPDVVLMDIRMPVVDGLRATREIAADPDLAGVHVLILTTFDHDEYVIEALGAGAAGFLIKNTEPGQLLHGIRVVAGGEALLSPGLTRRLIARLSDTARDPAAECARPGPAHRPGEGDRRTRRARPEQLRHRRRTHHQPRHREDPRQPRDGQAGRPRPRTAGRLGLPTPPRRTTGPGRARVRRRESTEGPVAEQSLAVSTAGCGMGETVRRAAVGGRERRGLGRPRAVAALPVPIRHSRLDRVAHDRLWAPMRAVSAPMISSGDDRARVVLMLSRWVHWAGPARSRLQQVSSRS